MLCCGVLGVGWWNPEWGRNPEYEMGLFAFCFVVVFVSTLSDRDLAQQIFL